MLIRMVTGLVVPILVVLHPAVIFILVTISFLGVSKIIYLLLPWRLLNFFGLRMFCMTSRSLFHNRPYSYVTTKVLFFFFFFFALILFLGQTCWTRLSFYSRTCYCWQTSHTICTFPSLSYWHLHKKYFSTSLRIFQNQVSRSFKSDAQLAEVLRIVDRLL